MDDPHAPAADLRDAYADLAFSNRWLGGTDVAVAACADLVRRAARDGADPVVVLDVGAGGGDVALALARWTRRAHVRAVVVALDASPVATAHARAAARDDDRVRVVRGDLRRLPFAEGAVHVVHAGQVLHHVPRAEQADVLRTLCAVARTGVAVTDLEASPLAFHLVRAFATLTGRQRFYRHDAPVSVARAFTLEEARELARRSGIASLRVERRPFWRLSLVAGPPAAPRGRPLSGR
jgi:SAM-dependent methyltransferase